MLCSPLLMDNLFVLFFTTNCNFRTNFSLCFLNRILLLLAQVKIEASWLFHHFVSYFDFPNLTQKWYLFSLGKSFSDIYYSMLQGLIFLVYPLLGHLADVYLTRYCMLKCGAGILVTNGIILFLWILVTAIIDLNITHV